jgi:lipoate-protein ligase A
MTPCRLIIDPPQEGAWNMAVDEALLNDAADRGVASLRFYMWSAPTLSLGYFQRVAERETHPASRGAAMVRRLSGGGALVHDREITYSLALPASHPLARRPAELYPLVHRALVDALAAAGVAARRFGDAAGESPPAAAGAPAEEPFLCFARRTAEDLVLSPPDGGGGPKIAGSAQRRRRGAVLQHGSLLVGASPAAPELPGLLESAAAPALHQLIPLWSNRLGALLGLRLAPAIVDGALAAAAAELVGTKYALATWNEAR